MQAGYVLLLVLMVTSVRGYLVSPLPRTPGPGLGLHPWAAPASPVSVLLPPATARVICSACRYHPPPTTNTAVVFPYRYNLQLRR